MNAYFYTLGCKVNQYETEAISEKLKEINVNTVSEEERADVFIINSCTVTEEGSKKSRKAVRHFKRKYPDKIVILTGCYPQAFPEEAGKITEADIITGNKSNCNLNNLLLNYSDDRRRIVAISPYNGNEAFNCDCIKKLNEKTRAIIKVEDGCNRFCSYCIIPYARGRVRSKPMSVIEAELKNIKSNGYKEIVIVGINLSAYGMNTEYNICDVVKAAEKAEFDRIRLGSLEPDHITDDILEGLAEAKSFCPQFHISLQSGSNKILKNMNRHYTREEYIDLCRKIRKQFFNASITTDIMVGFPGETENEFNESLSIIDEIKFEKVHVFPYSPRKGTKAAEMIQTEKLTKEERCRKMISFAENIRKEYFKKQIGSTVEVLFEERNINNHSIGYTKNYIPVLCKETIPPDTILKILITDSDDEFCIGKITE